MGDPNPPQVPSDDEPRLVDELLQFLREEKKWWLGPILVVALLVTLLVLYTRGDSLAPFIYQIF